MTLCNTFSHFPSFFFFFHFIRFFVSVHWQGIDTRTFIFLLILRLNLLWFSMSCARLVPGPGWFTCDVLFCYDHRGAGGFAYSFFRMDTWFSLKLFPSLDRRSWVFFVCMCLSLPRYQLGCVFFVLFSFSSFLRVRAPEKVRSRHSLLKFFVTMTWHECDLSVAYFLIYIV